MPTYGIGVANPIRQFKKNYGHEIQSIILNNV